MVKMIDVEGNGDWIVPEHLCGIDKNNKKIFLGCPGCTERVIKDEILEYETDTCDVYKVFEIRLPQSRWI